MELDLQSLFGLHVHCCTYSLAELSPPPPSPPPGIWAHILRRYQPRQTTSLCDPPGIVGTLHMPVLRIKRQDNVTIHYIRHRLSLLTVLAHTKMICTSFFRGKCHEASTLIIIWQSWMNGQPKILSNWLIGSESRTISYTLSTVTCVCRQKAYFHNVNTHCNPFRQQIFLSAKSIFPTCK